jgi:predicted acylesterase/phospholipase RssA
LKNKNSLTNIRPTHDKYYTQYQSWKKKYQNEGSRIKGQIIYLPGGFWVSAVITCAILQFFVDYDIRPDVISCSSGAAMPLAMGQFGYPPLQSLYYIHYFDLKIVQNKLFRLTYLNNEKLLEHFARFHQNGDNFLLNNANNINEIKKNSFKVTFLSTNVKTGKAEVLVCGNLIKAVASSSAFPGIYKPFKIKDKKLMDGFFIDRFPLERIIEIFEIKNPEIIKLNIDQSRIFKLIRKIYSIYKNGFNMTTQRREIKNLNNYPLDIDTDRFKSLDFGHNEMWDLFEYSYKFILEIYLEEDQNGSEDKLIKHKRYFEDFNDPNYL